MTVPASKVCCFLRQDFVLLFFFQLLRFSLAFTYVFLLVLFSETLQQPFSIYCFSKEGWESASCLPLTTAVNTWNIKIKLKLYSKTNFLCLQVTYFIFKVDRYGFLLDMLVSGHRPVLLTGAPGVGKTSLVQVRAELHLLMMEALFV